MPLPYDPNRPVSRAGAVTNLLRIAEVANRHKVPLRYHTGIPMGYTAAYSAQYSASCHQGQSSVR